MNANNVVKEVFTDLQRGHFNKASELLAENFRTIIMGRTVNRSIYISTCRAIIQGMPDIEFDVLDIRAEGNKVMAKIAISGTNDRPMPALMKGWHQIPATNKKVGGLVAGLEITLNGDKIVEIKPQGNEKGLFINLLDHLGLDYITFREN